MKKFIKKNFYLIYTIILGSLLHMGFFSVNLILKNADSFAYLQMSYHLKNLSIEGFGTGWFGFLYSFLIAIFDGITFSLNEYFAALVLNIILFGVSALVIYKIGEKYLEKKHNLLLIALFYLSSILLHFNIGVLSENIYIPLFLGLVLFLVNKMQGCCHPELVSGSIILLDEEKHSIKDSGSSPEGQKVKNIFYISLLLALLYFTRAEAFIYLGSIIILLFFYIFKNNKNYKLQITNCKLWNRFFKNTSLLVLFFILIISPYLGYLHSITGEWGLTNKGSSNLRQAELRGTDKMDDEGFEQAVGELTSDNHHLKSGFVGGLKYDKGEETKGLINYLIEKPKETLSRIITNQVKLYTKNLPEMIISDSIKLYYKSWLFIPILIIPLLLVLYGAYAMFKNKEYDFLLIFASFYFVASFFFTLFFILNRYFIIFLPLFLILLVYGIQELRCNKGPIKNILIILVLGIYLVGDLVYYNNIKNEDKKYEVKKIAGEYLRMIENDNNSHNKNLKILERFPIVTYYSGTKERWITPYIDNLDNLIEYAKFNKIDYLVVDTLDFKTYRPKLDFMLDEDYQNKSLHKIITIQVNNEKVILYKFSL